MTPKSLADLKRDARGVWPLSRSKFFHFHAIFGKQITKQVCIPVGCVLPASWLYLPACTVQGGLSAPREGCLLLGVVSVPGGCLLPGGSAIIACTETDLPSLWTEWLTDRCKTKPSQTSFSGGNNRLTLAFSVGKSWIHHCKGPVTPSESENESEIFLDVWTFFFHFFCWFFDLGSLSPWLYSLWMHWRIQGGRQGSSPPWGSKFFHFHEK